MGISKQDGRVAIIAAVITGLFTIIAAMVSNYLEQEPAESITTYEWTDADPPKKMIQISEGICYLTMITGQFKDLNVDVAEVYEEDGHWYLGGSTGDHATGAGATCRRLP